jgi:two-component system LytT family sensor kinase
VPDERIYRQPTPTHKQQLSFSILKKAKPDKAFGPACNGLMLQSKPGCADYFYDFAAVKRILFHLLFWTTYLLQNTLLAFFWDLPKLNNLPDGARLALAFKLCLAPLLFKMVFTYLVVYVILDRIVKQKGRLSINIFYWIAAAAGTVVLIRAVQTFFIYPLVFQREIQVPYFLSTFSFLYALIDLGFVSGAAIAIKQVRTQLKNKEREKQLLQEKLETELKYLKNQLNPHFLFNTLNNIYALARKKSDDTADVVMKLSKILRFMLYESGKVSISIEEEVRLIEDYIDLEKLRYRDKVKISFISRVDQPAQEISPFLLLPFVENAFKHGVSESFFHAAISIQLHLEKEQLFFKIENTKEQLHDKGTSQQPIGLYNSKRQLELTYADHNLEISNKPDRFTVLLNVNLSKNGKA